MRRQTIATLMVVVSACGIAAAALKNASDTWACVLFGLTLLLLGSAVAGVVYRRESRRAFWLGFCVFGWGYLTIVMAPWFQETVRPTLPTQLFLEQANQWLQVRSQPTNFTPINSLVVDSAAPPIVDLVTPVQVTRVPDLRRSFVRLALYLAPTTNAANFALVGHQLFTLLAAALGGVIFRWFHRTNTPT